MTLLWGGRFREAGDPVLWEFTVSPADRRLLKYDVEGSKAHVRMLRHVGLISAAEEKELSDGLEKITAEAEEGRFEFRDTDEDVHSAVERRLKEISGDVADKLHTGRSRNDQVALDLRLYLRHAVRARIQDLAGMIETLLRRAEETGDVPAPVYTHLQQAQAVPLAHSLLAYAWMLLRDVDRFRDAGRRIAVSPLGAGAAGGSSLPLDPGFSAKELGLPRTFDNSIDAVASRDFASEYVFCAAQAMVHLSRLGEDLVLWSSKEFGWITLPDELSTGSSMLPQKKNPDIAELARGKSAGVIGDVTTLLTLQKGLPLAYNRDLQEDKPAVFHADDTLAATLKALAALVGLVEFHVPAPDASVLAIDLAEKLVELGVPFRQAHRAVGSLVLSLSERKESLNKVACADLKAAHPLFREEDLNLLRSDSFSEQRRSPGGGSVSSVRDQIRKLKEILQEVKS